MNATPTPETQDPTVQLGNITSASIQDVDPTVDIGDSAPQPSVHDLIAEIAEMKRRERLNAMSAMKLSQRIDDDATERDRLNRALQNQVQLSDQLSAELIAQSELVAGSEAKLREELQQNEIEVLEDDEVTDSDSEDDSTPSKNCDSIPSRN